MIKSDQSEFSLDISVGHYGNNVTAFLAALGCKKNVYVFLVFLIAPSCMKETSIGGKEATYKETQRKEMKKDNHETMVCALDPPIPKIFSYTARGREGGTISFFLN